MRLFEQNIDKHIILYLADFPLLDYQTSKGHLRFVPIKEDKTIQIEWMEVDEEFQGQGYGQQLLEYLKKWAKDNQYGRIELDDMSERFMKGDNIYLRSGFRYQKYGYPEMFFVV